MGRCEMLLNRLNCSSQQVLMCWVRWIATVRDRVQGRSLRLVDRKACGRRMSLRADGL